MTTNLLLEYDESVDAAYLTVSEETWDHQVRLDDSRGIDCAADGSVIGIEILDVDLLIVFDRLEDRSATRIAIRRMLSDLPIDKDLFVVSHDEVVRRGAVVGSIVGQALREGVVLHGR